MKVILDGGNLDNGKIPIFLSYAKPFNQNQEIFINNVKSHLKENDFDPLTLGETYVGISDPMVNIKDMMNVCYGLLSIAFRRAYIKSGTRKPGTELANQEETDISNKWITSPYCHIEPAMAFQIDMPILIFRQTGVIDDGILEKGAIPSHMPVFDLDTPNDEYFNSLEWTKLMEDWKALVLTYKTKKQFAANDIIKQIISYSICEGNKISPDQLYDMFNSTIDPYKRHWSGQRSNDPDHFCRQLGSYLKVDEADIQTRYKKTGRFLIKDYITICSEFFK